MRPAKLCRLECVLISVVAVCMAAVGLGQDRSGFRKHVLNADSQFSACCVFDVDGDGRPDVFAGGFWYRAPDWKRHRVRDVQSIRGRFDDYANLPMDVNDDGWTDVISVNYRSQSLYWVEHPGPDGIEAGSDWQRHVMDTPGPSETGRLVDVDGDGALDVLPNGVKFAAWYRRERGSWIKELLPREIAAHGLGAGDIDGDGRTDLASPAGWLQAPAEPRKQRWQWRPEFRLHRDASVPILVVDVDGDSDSDIIWGRGHNVGLYWMEQHRAGESQADPSERWTQHTIDTEISSAHSLLWADVDGDGKKDLIAGKRYLGHDGRDPGEYDPLPIYGYSFDTTQRTWRRGVISLPDEVGFDLDPAAADLDGDGDLDVVAPSRNGLYWFENLGAAKAQRTLAPPYADHTKLDSVRGEDGELRPLPQASRGSPATEARTAHHAARFDWGRRRMHILDGMQHAMGPLPGPRFRTPLRVQILKREQAEGYQRVLLRYQPEPDDWAPAYLLIPDGLDKPAPAMLCLHQTTRIGKGEPVGLGGKPSLHYAHELAQRGYICLAPDYPSFGDYDYDFEKPGRAAISGSMKAIWNNLRAVDLLEARKDVDGDRIGVIGHSLGGHNSLFTAAFDQRLRAVVTSCGFNAFHHYYGGDLKGWTSQRYMPRIRERYHNSPDEVPFDFHEVIAALAPRPVFINAPLHDSNFAVEGVREVVASAKGIYRLTEAEPALRVAYPDSEHDFPDEVRQDVYQWLDGVLKP